MEQINNSLIRNNNSDLSVSKKPTSEEIKCNDKSNNQSSSVSFSQNDLLSLKYKDSSKPVKIYSFEGTTITNYDSSVIKKETNDNSPYLGNGNGILNTEEQAQETCQMVQDISGKNINLLYNPTHGIGDVAEAIGELTDSSSVKQVAKVLNHLDPNSENQILLTAPGVKVAKQVFDISKEKNIEVQIADQIYNAIDSGHKSKIMVHSQGAAILADALNLVRNRLLEKNNSLAEIDLKMSNVSVLTIGGFAARKDFPDQVKITTIENTIKNSKGLDPVSFIANTDADLLPSTGDLDFKANYVKKKVSEDPNRSTLEKKFVNTMIDGSTAIASNMIKNRKNYNFT